MKCLVLPVIPKNWLVIDCIRFGKISLNFQEVTSRFRAYLAMGHEALNQVIDEVPSVLTVSPKLNAEVFISWFAIADNGVSNYEYNCNEYPAFQDSAFDVFFGF